jgi:ribose transport system substrate-binding protein
MLRGNFPCQLALLVLTLVGITGCGQPGPKRLILLNNADAPYWDAVRKGIQAAEKDLDLKKDGYVAVLEINDGTLQGQISKLRQFASQPDIAAVAVSPIDATNAAIADELRKLKERGIKVITADGEIDRAKFRDCRLFYLGTENHFAGQQAGICAKQLQPDGGGYVLFVGQTGAQNAIDRMDGFQEGAGKAFKELNRMGDGVDRSIARDNVRNALRNFPDVKVLGGIWCYNGPAIVDVLKEQNKRGNVKVVSFDAEPGTIPMMEQGMIDVMVVQNPYKIGYDTVRLLKALASGDEATVKEMYPNAGKEDGDLLDTGLRIVVPNDSSPLKKEMFDSSVEFMDLEQFKAWLAERNLECS